MRLLGAAEGACVVVVGTWDPLTPTLIELIVRVKRRALALNGSAAVVLIDPPPTAILHGRWEMPTFDDPRQRVAILRAAGADVIAIHRMKRKDLDLGASEFLAHLLTILPVTEIWIRPRQSFGRGPIGAKETMEQLAHSRNISVVSPRVKNERFAIMQVRQALASGHIQRAQGIMKRSPIWFKPRNRTLHLAWLPGWYTVKEVGNMQATSNPLVFKTRLKKGKAGEAVMEWPTEDVPALAFLGGPRDVS
jgi:FAD synthase